MAIGVPTTAVISFAWAETVGLLAITMTIVAGGMAMAANLNCLDRPTENSETREPSRSNGNETRDK